MHINSYDGSVTIASINDDNITYLVKYAKSSEGHYYRLTIIDEYIEETDIITYVGLESLCKAFGSFSPRVSESLRKQCDYFHSPEGRREFQLMPDNIKSPTQTITVCEVTDIDGTYITIKMVPDGWQLIKSNTGGAVGRYITVDAVFANLRGNCSLAALKALVAQYRQLKSRFEFEPYTAGDV